MAEKRPDRKKANQGMNWIRKPRRLAINLRDGMACAYCGEGIEDGATLTLDHIVPYCLGGTNDTTNLVTACRRCNSKRGKRDVGEFVAAVAAYINHGVTAEMIMAFIEETRNRPIDVAEAKEMIARRGGFANAMRG